MVVGDCCTSLYGEDLHRFAIENISRCFGWVLTVDEVQAKLSRGRRAFRLTAPRSPARSLYTVPCPSWAPA